MKYLFNPEGLRALRNLDPHDTYYAFDYDGTLAPIVRQPEKAIMSAKTASLMQNLSRRADVAIVSGRGQADLKTKINFKVSTLIGNHGIENPEHKNRLAHAKKNCARWIKQLGREKIPPGCEIEDKKYSLTLHYRQAARPAEAQKFLLSLVENLQPRPQIILGKKVINLLDPLSPHKGHALAAAFKKSGKKILLFIGDDDTDEKVFSMTNTKMLTIRVGKKHDSKALFYLRRQSEINAFLQRLTSPSSGK